MKVFGFSMQNIEENIDFKSLDKTLRKQRLIDTAIKVFHEKGYRTATLEDVAKDLGVTKAALYHYVSSKEELLSVIYIQALENFFEKAYKIGELDLAPPEKMRVLIRHHLKHTVIENLAIFAVFFSEENQLPEKDFEKIRIEKRKYTRVFEDIFKAGMEEGSFELSDPKLLAFAIIGMCNWLYRWYKPGDDYRSPDEIVDHFLHLLEHGFLRVNESTAENGEASTAEPRTESTPIRKRQLIDRIKGRAQELEDLIEQLENIV